MSRKLEDKAFDRQHLQELIAEKMKENNEKYRNRSKVGTIIKMHELVDKASKDHITKSLKTRHILDRDQYVRKILEFETAAYN